MNQKYAVIMAVVPTIDGVTDTSGVWWLALRVALQGDANEAGALSWFEQSGPWLAGYRDQTSGAGEMRLIDVQTRKVLRGWPVDATESVAASGEVRLFSIDQFTLNGGSSDPSYLPDGMAGAVDLVIWGNTPGGEFSEDWLQRGPEGDVLTHGGICPNSVEFVGGVFP